MARVFKRLALQLNADTVLNNVYAAPAGFNTSAAVLGFTNLSATDSVVISVYQNDGTSDFLLTNITLPAGIGRERFYYGFQRSVLNAGDTLKIQADNSTSFNISFYGSEVEL